MYQSRNGFIPDIGILVYTSELDQKRCHIGRCQHYIIQLVLRETKPAIHFIEKLACKVSGQPDFIIDTKVIHNFYKDTL